MPRTRNNSRKEAERKAADREENVHLAQIKIDSALLKIDEMARRYKEKVDHQLKLIRDTTDKQLLQMKWSDFVALKIDHFADYQESVPTRSRSATRKRKGIRTKQQTWTRVQSVDRERKDEAPTLGFLRWPRAGELVLSKAGSPLAVLKTTERCANVHIPTSKGVITVKPHKISEVSREVLMTLDQNTLNQVKALSSNLVQIVDMANKIGK